MTRTTFQAIITGDRVTWIGEAPDSAQPLHATVRLKDEAPAVPTTDGPTLARAIREIVAETGGVRSIADPVAWQREQRVDRPLPGREP